MEESIKLDIGKYSQHIIENTEDVVWVLDLATTKFMFVSPSVYKLRGYTPEEAVKQTMQEVLTSESYQRVSFALTKRVALFESGDVSVKIQKHDADFIHKDGSIIPTEIVTILIANQHGKVIEILGITRNISERRNFIKQSQQNAEEHISLKEQYLSTIEGLKDLNEDLVSLNKQLAESEEHFRLLIENAPIPIFIQSNGKFQYINKKAISLFNADFPDQLIGQSFLNGLQPNYKQIAEDRIKNVNLDLKPVPPLDEQFITVDGKIVDVEVSAVPFRYKNENGALVFLHDLTERKKYENQILENERRLRQQNEEYRALNEEYRTINEDLKENNEKLRLSEERFSKTFSSNPVAMVITRMSDGVIIDVNESYLKILGYERDVLIGHNGDELNIFNDNSEQKKLFEWTKDHGSVYDYETILNTKSGEKRHTILSVEIIKLNNENCLLSTFRDITKLKKAETSISEMQEQFRLAFLTSPDSITISRLNDGTYVQVNDGFCQLTGYRQNEVIGKTALEINIWEDEAERNRLLKLLLKDGIVKNMKTKFRFKNGIVHTGLISASIIVLNGEKHMIAVTRDIQDIVKTQEELVKAKEQAQESDRLKSVFLQNMSHEIRTPMNAIMGFANLIPSYFDEKEKLLEFAQIINQRSSDLLEIINDILDLSKIETGQLPIHLEPCNLNDIFTELNDFFINHRKKINKESIDIIIYPICDPVQSIVITDKIKLKQIFINLIYNAFKFTEIGKIEVGCNLDEDKNIVFYVSDTGIGIPPDKQSIIFERFVQVDEYNHSQGGTGLGLAIVKGLVELLGGTIRVESRSGMGTKFLFTFQYAVTNENIHTSDKFPDENLSDFSSSSILIVEDDEYSRLYIEEILSGNGLRIHHVNTGKKAIDFVQSNSVDIILMDIRLPEMQGYEATRLIKEKHPQVKIIAQTAYASSSDRKKALDAGCDDYISKPINKHLLFTKIYHFLQKEKNL